MMLFLSQILAAIRDSTIKINLVPPKDSSRNHQTQIRLNNNISFSFFETEDYDTYVGFDCPMCGNSIINERIVQLTTGYALLNCKGCTVDFEKLTVCSCCECSNEKGSIYCEDEPYCLREIDEMEDDGEPWDDW